MLCSNWNGPNCEKVGDSFEFTHLARIIHEADIVCHHFNGRQNLRGYLTQNTVHAKPEAQAKENCEIPSLALQA